MLSLDFTLSKTLEKRDLTLDFGGNKDFGDKTKEKKERKKTLKGEKLYTSIY